MTLAFSFFILLFLTPTFARTITQKIISCSPTSVNGSVPYTCSCLFECTGSGNCTNYQFPCSCVESHEMDCRTTWTTLEFVRDIHECFGINSNDSDVCGGRGICESENICQCHYYATGDFCEENRIVVVAIDVVTKNLWFIIIVGLTMILIAALLIVYCVVATSKKDLSHLLHEIENRKKTLKVVNETFFMLEELTAKLHVANDEVIAKNLTKLEKVLQRRVIDTYGINKCLKYIVCLFTEIEKKVEDDPVLIYEIGVQRRKFEEKDLQSRLSLKKHQKQKFVNYNKDILKHLLEKKKKGDVISKKEVIEKIDIDRKISRIQKDVDDLEKKIGVLDKKRKEDRRKKRQTMEIELVKKKDDSKFTGEEMEIVKDELGKQSDMKAKLKWEQIIYYMQSQVSVPDKTTDKLMTEEVIELEEQQQQPNSQPRELIEMNRIVINSRCKWRTIRQQRLEKSQNQLEEILEKIKTCISNNVDSETRYYCHMFREKLFQNYLNVDTPLLLLRGLTEAMELILEKNENNIEMVINPVVTVLLFTVETTYFRQAEDGMKMCIDEKENLHKLCTQFEDKFGESDYSILFHLKLIKECLLIIEDTSEFIHVLFKSINLLNPSPIAFLIVQKLKHFQRRISFSNITPYFIELMTHELHYQLHPIEFDDFIEFEYNCYYLQMYKIDILSRICFYILDIGGIEHVFHLIPTLVAGEEIAILLNQAKNVRELASKKDAKSKEEKKDVQTTEVIVIEADDEKKGEQIVEIVDDEKEFHHSVYIRYQLINFSHCWNELQELMVKNKDENVQIEAMRLSSKIASKANKLIRWDFIRKKFKSNQRILEMIEKFEALEDQYYLYNKYVLKVVCDHVFLDLKIPISFDQYWTFNNNKSMKWLYEKIKITGKKKCFLVEGISGIGKTSLLSHLSYYLYYNMKIFSFFIKGPVLAKYYTKWRENSSSLETKYDVLMQILFESFDFEFAQVFSHQEILEFKMQIKQILSRKFCFIIDSFDEIDTKEKFNFLKFIHRLLVDNDFAPNKMIIASRSEAIRPFHSSFLNFFRVKIDQMGKENCKKLVISTLEHNNKEGIDAIMKRFSRVISHLEEEMSVPLINVLLLKRLLEEEESSDQQIMNSRFAMYENLVLGAIRNDVSKIIDRKSNVDSEDSTHSESVARCNVYWILNLLSVIGYLNKRMENPKRNEITHILNKRISLIIDSEVWLADIPNPITKIIDSLLDFCGLISANKNYIFFTNTQIEDFCAARFLVNPDKNESLSELRRIFNMDDELSFALLKESNDLDWREMYSFYFSYYSAGKILSLEYKKLSAFLGSATIETEKEKAYSRIISQTIEMTKEYPNDSEEMSRIMSNVFENVSNQRNDHDLYIYLKTPIFANLKLLFHSRLLSMKSVKNIMESENEEIQRMFCFLNDDEFLFHIKRRHDLMKYNLRTLKKEVVVKGVDAVSCTVISNGRRVLVTSKIFDLNTGKLIIDLSKMWLECLCVRGDCLAYITPMKPKKLFLVDLNEYTEGIEPRSVAIAKEYPKIEFYSDNVIVFLDYKEISLFDIGKEKLILSYKPSFERPSFYYSARESLKNLIFVYESRDSCFHFLRIDVDKKTIVWMNKFYYDCGVRAVQFCPQSDRLFIIDSKCGFSFFDIKNMKLVKRYQICIGDNMFRKSFDRFCAITPKETEIVIYKPEMRLHTKRKFYVLSLNESEEVSIMEKNEDEGDAENKVFQFDENTVQVFKSLHEISFEDQIQKDHLWVDNSQNTAIEYDVDHEEIVRYSIKESEGDESFKEVSRAKFNIRKCEKILDEKVKIYSLANGKEFVIFDGIDVTLYDENQEKKTTISDVISTSKDFFDYPSIFLEDEKNQILVFTHRYQLAVINLKDFSLMMDVIDLSNDGKDNFKFFKLYQWCGGKIIGVSNFKEVWDLQFDFENKKLEKVMLFDKKITRVFEYAKDALIFNSYNKLFVYSFASKECTELCTFKGGISMHWFYFPNTNYILQENNKMYNIFTSECVYHIPEDFRDMEIHKFGSSPDVFIFIKTIKNIGIFTKHFQNYGFQECHVVKFDTYMLKRTVSLKKTVLVWKNQTEKEKFLRKYRGSEYGGKFHGEIMKYMKEFKEIFVRTGGIEKRVDSEEDL